MQVFQCISPLLHRGPTDVAEVRCGEGAYRLVRGLSLYGSPCPWTELHKCFSVFFFPLSRVGWPVGAGAECFPACR